jgi:hypothetical protein
VAVISRILLIQPVAALVKTLTLLSGHFGVFAFLTVFVFLERLAAVLLAPCLLRGATAV